jgi:phytoene dehydrogenase-like protein
MRETAAYDAIVVGGGHNGLVAAAYLAKAGRSVLVLERREILGGAAVSEAVWPGWTVSTASYVCGLLHPRIIAELDLVRLGYHAYAKEWSSFTPLLDGRSLLLGHDAAANAREIATFDPADVAGFARFGAEATRLGALLFDEFERDEPAGDFDADTQATLRGSVAALVERYVRTPALQATLAVDGLIGTYAGPRDPGTAYVLAHHYAGRALGTQGGWGYVRGGMGGVSRAIALAGLRAGCVFRTSANVTRILVRNGTAYGVALDDGSEYVSSLVLSNADPVETFANLLAPADVPPELSRKLAGWKIEGCSLKLNLALGELPDFSARPGRAVARPQHHATLHVAPSLDYEQAAHDDARTLGFSRAPVLEGFMQTPSEPGLAPPGKHLLSIFAQYYPYAGVDGPWTDAKRETVADSIVATIAAYAPNLPDAIEARQILAPPDLERRFGLHGGHIFHGELLPGQILGERFATRTPIAGLLLCGSSASPGGCVSGIPGWRAADAALREPVPA